MREGKKKCV